MAIHVLLGTIQYPENRLQASRALYFTSDSQLLYDRKYQLPIKFYLLSLLCLYNT